MKVSLVVAAGAHEGRVIPLTSPRFLIGRDEQCNLRPASPAISKLHCAVVVRDGKVYVKDFGSTNGTQVNDAVVQAAEVEVADGASIRIGPLDFRLRVEKVERPDGTPLPSPESAAALAAVKAAAATAPKAPARDTTPSPVRQSGTVPQPAAKPPASRPGTSPLAPSKPGGSKEVPALKAAAPAPSPDEDEMAALLLGMDDDGNGGVPDGSTVMDIPTPLAGTGEADAKAGEKKEDDKPKKAQTREEMSSAANDLLRKYMRRPK